MIDPLQYIKGSAIVLFIYFIVNLIFAFGATASTIMIIFGASAIVFLLAGIFGYFGVDKKNINYFMLYIIFSGLGFAASIGIITRTFTEWNSMKEYFPDVAAENQGYYIAILAIYFISMVITLINVIMGVKIYKELKELADKLPL